MFAKIKGWIIVEFEVSYWIEHNLIIDCDIEIPWIYMDLQATNNAFFSDSVTNLFLNVLEQVFKFCLH